MPDELVDRQAEFDVAFQALNLRAPPPMRGEAADDYRRRALRELQPYVGDNALRDADLDRLPPGPSLDHFEAQILSQSLVRANDKAQGDFTYPAKLRPIRRRDTAGREMVEWAGEPRAWMDQFAGPVRYVRRLGAEGDPRADLANRQRATVDIDRRR